MRKLLFAGIVLAAPLAGLQFVHAANAPVAPATAVALSPGASIQPVYYGYGYGYPYYRPWGYYHPWHRWAYWHPYYHPWGGYYRPWHPWHRWAYWHRW